MALSPIQYTFSGQTPMQAGLQGLQLGEQIKLARGSEERAQNQEQRTQQLFPSQLRSQELGVQQKELSLQAQEQQIAAQRQQMQRAEMYRQAIADVTTKGSAATYDDFASLSAEFPEQGAAIMEMYEAMDETRREPLVSMLAQSAAALRSGKPEIGIEVAKEFASAAREAGDLRLAGMADGAIKLAEINPDAAHTQIGTLLAQIDPDLAKSVLSATSQGEEPAGVTALRIRAQEAGLEPGSNEYREFMLSGGAEKGIAIEVGPDGTVRFAEGGAGDSIFGDKPPTEGQLASAGYLQRMTGAEQTFDQLEAEGVTRIPFFAAQTVGTAAENLTLDSGQRRLLQAQRDWVRAKLRKESGAVIGDEEMAEEVKTYFPQPNDGPKEVEQKRVARERATRQMQITSGPAAPLAEGEAQEGGQAPAAQSQSPLQQRGIEDAEVDFYLQMQKQGGPKTPEERQRLQDIAVKLKGGQ